MAKGKGMKTQASSGKPVGGQKMAGAGAVMNWGQGKNPPVVQKAGATQDGKVHGNYSAGKR